jgi:transmembrane sensor
MSNIINLSDHGHSNSHLVDEEARVWLVRLDSKRPAEDVLNEFQEWLSRHPENKQAFQRAFLAWNDLDLLSTILEPSTQYNQTSASKDILTRIKSSGLELFRPMIVSLGIILSLVAGVISYKNLSMNYGIQTSNVEEEYSTAIGQQRLIALPDGSVMQMNTDSTVNVNYLDDSRRIYMPEGEVWFDVQHNPEKPFIVYAGLFMVRAVGTAFTVKIKEDGSLGVTVTDGRVEVTLSSDAVTGKKLPDIEVPTNVMPMIVGKHMVFDTDFGELTDWQSLVQKMDPVQIEKRISWRDGILIFDNDPLEVVVAELNRYTQSKIVISDSGIRDLRFGGYFRANDVNLILATLDKNYGIRVDEIKENLIYLSRKNMPDL